MNKFMNAFMKLLPLLIMGVQKQSANVAGKDKKQMVLDGLATTAAAVGALAPQHAQAASDAADVAGAALEGVLLVLKDSGHPVFVQTPTPTPTTGISLDGGKTVVGK